MRPIPTILLLIASLMTGCAGQERPSSDLIQADAVHDRFSRYLDGCTRLYQFDPKADTALGETELGSTEREWRSCAYDGVRAIMMPSSARPELYAWLIAEDRKMTDRVGRGEMTRSERRSRLEQLDEEILLTERDLQRARNAQMVRQVFDNIRGY